MKNKTLWAALALLALGISTLRAQTLPTGHRVHQLMVSTNSGVVYWGSGSVDRLTWTNAQTFSNSVEFAAGSVVTNHGSLVVSNLVMMGSLQESLVMRGLSSVTNHDLVIGSANSLVFTNQTEGDIVISGFLPRSVTMGELTNSLWMGRILRVVNASGTNCTFLGSSTNSTDFCRILLPSGTSTNIGGRGAATFLYFSTNWHLIHLLP